MLPVDSLTQMAEIIGRLLLAVFLGGVIGYQREASEKPAGLRTHALVSLGSALIMVISIGMAIDFENADATRIAANVVAGIGFLGGGAIIRQGSIVRGLTTAASIWAVAGIGLAAGGGFYLESIFSTLLILLTLSGLKRLESMAVAGHRTLQVMAQDTPKQLGQIISTLGELEVTVRFIEIEPLEGEGANVVQLNLQIPSDVDYDDVLARVASLSGVTNVQWITRPLVGEG